MATTLSSLHLLNLLEYATYKGIDTKELKALLYSPEAEQAEGRVSAEEYCKVWGRAAQLSSDAYFGLHFGYFLNLKALGLIYQISLAATSIEQALGLLEEYLRDSFPLVSLVTGASHDHFYIELHSHLTNEEVKNPLLDSVLFLMYREIGLMIEGEIAEVQLPYDDLREYQRLCPGPVVPSDNHRLKLDTRQLAGPINRRRLKNVEALLPVFLQLIGQDTTANGLFTEQVRKMTLSLCSPELPTLDEVVAQFALSHRTFQRRLAEEGTSFRAVADEIKRQMASHLVRGKSLGTQDIAYLLGYSGPSAYLHAVKKWRSQQQPELTRI